ncbi:MAG TPA: hypothetical protein VGC52_02740 [Gemmatimonadaceae bacterium]
MTAGLAAETPTLDSILDQLNEFHQRATYGAVAGVVNSSPRSLMTGRERDPRSSWIVRRETGLPTGYRDEQKHSALTEREKIIGSPDELRAWLTEPA